nr:MAG TPA: Protocadherin-15, LHFPL5, protocadherin, tip link [Caudoviricetes sp.]
MDLKSTYIIDILLYIIGIFFSISLIFVIVIMAVTTKRYINRRK